MRNKGFIHILVLILVVLGIGLLGYFSWQNGLIKTTSTQNAEPTIIQDETLNWETYSNDLFGYQVKYPPVLKPSTLNGTLVVFGKKDGTSGPLMITAHSGNESDKEFFNESKNIIEQNLSQPEYKIVKKVVIDKYEAYQTKTETDLHISIMTITKKDDTYYTLILAYKKDDVIISPNVYDQILSTFKFIDSSEIKPSNPIVIPSDWKKFTAEDPEFNTKTTMSLPPNFSFSFTGSEFIIQNDIDAQELWDYKTSVFRGWVRSCNKETDKFDSFSSYLDKCCSQQVINQYTGESRRVWYENYLNGNYSCNYPSSDAKMGTISSVKEKTAGNISYLEITVLPKYLSIPEVHYIYLQNGIINIFTPSSEKARTTDAQIPNSIPTILSSLEVSQTK